MSPEDLTFEVVWKNESPELIREVSDFWMAQEIFNSYDKAEERARQLVYVVRNPDRQIVAVSTAFRAYVKLLNNHFYGLRLLAHPAFRIPGLSSKLFVMTRDYCEAISQSDGDPKCIGVITTVENDRIRQYRREAVWPASGMVYIGKTPKGHHVRVYYFDGVEV